MQEMYEKYAKVLLEKGVNLKKGQPLLITAPVEAIEFLRVLGSLAYKMGSKDVYFDFEDEYLKKEILETYDVKELENTQFYNKKIFDEYSKKNAAFLMLTANDSDTMENVDNEKLSASAKILRTSKPIYKKMQKNGELAWCIASVATKSWANKLFPNDKKSLEKLWNTIFKCCLIDSNDPIKSWNEKLSLLEAKSNILNQLNLKELHYTNDLGTDLKISLSNKSIWTSGYEELKDGRCYVANIPTEEVFTTPNKFGTNGVVYAAKPLVYNGGLIEDMKITFKDGKVIEAVSKSNQKLLDSIINSHENMDYLGEIALVDYDSPISNSKIVFYETLYDENAACHLALGSGFKICIKNGINLNDNKLEAIGFNSSDGHVDFMIGTKDLKITGITYDDEEIEIFENGNFSKKIIKTM